VDYVNASLAAEKNWSMMKTELLKEEGTEEFLGVGPKANVAREITDLLCDLECWTKADAVMDGD